MPEPNNLTGQRFTRLVALEEGERRNRKPYWLCRCDCGNTISVRVDSLTTGNTQSCGCLRGELHGFTKSPTYQSWAHMKSRCLNPNDDRYADYGGAGIEIHKAWRDSFMQFLSDMGERPEGTSLDRFPDRNGNYEPKNCRWATPKEQQTNTKKTMFVEYDGVRKSLSAWAQELGIDRCTLYTRLRRKWPIARALTTTVQVNLRNRNTSL